MRLTSTLATALFAPALTRGPWSSDHQHAGPPSALVCRAIERAAASDGLTHLGRLTVNLFRPSPIGECRVEVAPDYVGRNAGHYSGRLTAEGKEVARFTALMQREDDLPMPEGTPGQADRSASLPISQRGAWTLRVRRPSINRRRQPTSELSRSSVNSSCGLPTPRSAKRPTEAKRGCCSTHDSANAAERRIG